MEDAQSLGRAASAGLQFCLLLLVLSVVLSCPNHLIVRAEGYTDRNDVQVGRVIQIEDGGALVINDTLALPVGGSQNTKSLDVFTIGFPFRFKKNLVYFYAYDDLGRVPTEMSASLNGDGFSWISVSIPERAGQNQSGSWHFKIVCVFSGLVMSNGTFFRADFPLYPSLREKASLCNVTVMLPIAATLNSTSPVLVNRTMDSRQVLNAVQSPLDAFANATSWVQFEAYDFRLLEVDEWKRNIEVGGLGECIVTDYCQITNRAQESLYTIPLVLPPKATDVSVQDAYGAYAGYMTTVIKKEDRTDLDVYLRESLNKDGKVRLLITYKLPFSAYVVKNSWQDYALNVSLVRPGDWIMKQFAVTVSLPEGAEPRLIPDSPYSLRREGFTVKAEFLEHNLTRFHELNANMEYRYLILWASFRPTLWVGTVVAVLGSVLFVRKTSKPGAVVAALLPPDVLRKFVDTYEERGRMKLRLRSLEEQVQKGKVSRRRYRLRKSSLDGRFSMLTKELTEIRGEIQAAGGRYLERMKQLETAEARIEALERDIDRVEARFRRGEVSAEVRHRLVGEYDRMREKAENAIAETLLRLREDIH